MLTWVWAQTPAYDLDTWRAYFLSTLRESRLTDDALWRVDACPSCLRSQVRNHSSRVRCASGSLRRCVLASTHPCSLMLFPFPFGISLQSREGCSLDSFLSKNLTPVKWEVSGKAQKGQKLNRGIVTQLLSGALHLGAITDPLLRWPDVFSAHLAPGFFSQFRAVPPKQKNDNLCTVILTIQIRTSDWFPSKIVSDFIVWGTFCDFYQGFPFCRYCVNMEKDFYKTASLWVRPDCCCIVLLSRSVFCAHEGFWSHCCWEEFSIIVPFLIMPPSPSPSLVSRPGLL